MKNLYEIYLENGNVVYGYKKFKHIFNVKESYYTHEVYYEFKPIFKEALTGMTIMPTLYKDNRTALNYSHFRILSKEGSIEFYDSIKDSSTRKEYLDKLNDFKVKVKKR